MSFIIVHILRILYGGGVDRESGIKELKGFFAENYWFLFNDGFTGGLSLHRLYKTIYIYPLKNLGTPSKTKSSTHLDLGLCRGTPTAVSKFSFFYISSVMWVRWVPFKIIVSRQYQSVSLGSFTVGQRIHVFSAPRETNLNFWSNLFLICHLPWLINQIKL